MPLQQGSVRSPAPGRLALGCVVAFGLTFAGCGLLALVQSAQQYATNSNPIVGIVTGGVFMLAGLGIVIGALYGAGNLKRTAALQTAHPDQPWMWRDDWANGAIRDTNKQNTIGLWVLAIIWNAISFPIAFVAAPQVADENKWMVMLVLLFPFAGVIMLISAIYQTLRSMKFGTSVCHLERVPIVPGRLFRGDVQLNSDAEPGGGYRLRIMLINAVSTRTGKNRSTSERLLWDAETVVTSSAAMRSPMGTRVPFQFATPPDAHPADDSDSCNRYLWRLSATAELPGVDYSAQFELPVFLSGAMADGSEFAMFEQRHRADAARQAIAPAAGVEISRLPGGGEQFRINAKRKFSSNLGSLMFLIIWNAAIAAMIHFDAPWGFPAVFIVIDLLLIAASIDYFFGRSTVSVNATGVQVRKEWFGSGSTKNYPAATIASIDGETAGQDSKSFGITMRLRDGGSRNLGSYLPDRESADAVAAKMMAGLGRS